MDCVVCLGECALISTLASLQNHAMMCAVYRKTHCTQGFKAHISVRLFRSASYKAKHISCKHKLTIGWIIGGWVKIMKLLGFDSSTAISMYCLRKGSRAARSGKHEALTTQTHEHTHTHTIHKRLPSRRLQRVARSSRYYKGLCRDCNNEISYDLMVADCCGVPYGKHKKR